MKQVGLNKIVYDKAKYGKTINNQFNELIPPTEEPAPPPITVDQFFQNYNEIFYDIPKTGDINSHEYLIRQSSEYINADVINNDITALLEEINNLRRELFELEEQRLREQTQNIQDAINNANTI